MNLNTDQKYSSNDMGVESSIGNVTRIISEAGSCYKPIKGESSRIILLPSDNNYESMICSASTLMYLPKRYNNREVLLIGHNKNKKKLNSQIVSIDDISDNPGLITNGQIIEKLNMVPIYTLIDPNADQNGVAEYLARWMEEDSSRVIAFVSNISSGNNQETINKNEDSFIRSLINGDIVSTSKLIDHLKIESNVELKILVMLVSKLKLRGKVVFYNDNMKKRWGWTTRDRTTTKINSYIGIAWGIDSHQLSSFDCQFLLSFAQSCLVSLVGNMELPELPLWSPWYQRRNGVFVSIKDQDTEYVISGIFRYESSENTVSNVIKSIFSIYNETKSGNPLTIDEASSVDVNIDILDLEKNWIIGHPEDISDIYPEDEYGLLLILPDGLSYSYTPDIWLMYPNMTFEEIMSELSEDAGGFGDEWMDSNSELQLYGVFSINRCVY